MFSTHVSTLAQGECIAQVLPSFDAVEPSLSVGISAAFDAAQDRKPCPFGECFGEGVGLVESAFSQSSRVKRHGDKIIGRILLYSCVLHGFDQKIGKHTAQIILATILETMDQVSQHALCLIAGHDAIKSRRAVFAVRTEEFSRHETFERSGAAAAEGRPETRRCPFA